MGTKLDPIFKIQKKAIRTLTNQTYIAHSEPLFKELGLNLSNELLPPYFNLYQTIISHSQHSTPRYALRPSARPLIRLPRINHTFAETRVLYQLIHLLNLTHEHTPEILIKINEKNHSYFGFGWYVKQKYLEKYTYDCMLDICYSCGRI